MLRMLFDPLEKALVCSIRVLEQGVVTFIRILTLNREDKIGELRQVNSGLAPTGMLDF